MIDPPAPEPTFILFAASISAVILPVVDILPTTVPVVIPTRTRAFVKYWLVPSITFEVVNIGVTAVITLPLVKYKLLVSLTSAVVRFRDATEVEFALMRPLASITIF